MKISDFVKQLDAQLAERPSGGPRVELAAQALCKAFGVKPDEVAIFSFDPQMQVVKFAWPEQLQASGFIPLSSPDSLVARTIREQRAYLNNRFSAVQHTSIFEHFRIDKSEETPPKPIQKIISAPLKHEESLTGAVQISRKGPTPSESGTDFSKNDLAVLVEIAKALSRHL